VEPTGAAGTSGALRKCGVPIAIVGGAFVVVHKDVVGLAELLEPLLRRRIVRVLVRVKLHRELAIRALDLLCRRLTADGEDLVIIALVLGSHCFDSCSCSWS
jgi:hypothetical protein